MADKTQAQKLIAIAQSCELFRTPDFECFATYAAYDCFQTWPVRSATFKRYLIHAFLQTEGKAPGSQALEDALKTIEAIATFEGPTFSVHCRIAGLRDRIYLDLGGEGWEAVEVTSEGWKVVHNPPVKFRRAPGMLALPRPLTMGAVDDLQSVINYGNNENWTLIVSWLLAALKPKGPFPLLVVLGEHGAAKSELQYLLRSLIDPSTTPLRTAPRCEDDLLIAARNSWVVSLDNLSYMPPWISDGLCRLSTGGGLSKRRLYTDADEQLLDAERPCILNSIESIVERTDLVDRALILDLPPIPEAKRRDRKAVRDDFRRKAPGILGALLTAVSAGLKNESSVKLERLPRMADFAIWMTACEPALNWPPGTFISTYSTNRKGAVEKTLEADLIGSAVRELVKLHGDWSGTSSELLDALEKVVDERTKKANAWPKSASWLARKLKRSMTFLRAVGIEVEQERSGSGRTIQITNREGMQNAVTAVTAVTTPENRTFRHDGIHDGNDGMRKMPSQRKLLPNNENDGNDGNDGKKRSHSEALIPDLTPPKWR